MNSKSTTRWLPLILVIALVLTFGLLLAAPAVTSANADTELLGGATASDWFGYGPDQNNSDYNIQIMDYSCGNVYYFLSDGRPEDHKDNNDDYRYPVGTEGSDFANSLWDISVWNVDLDTNITGFDTFKTYFATVTTIAGGVSIEYLESDPTTPGMYAVVICKEGADEAATKADPRAYAYVNLYEKKIGHNDEMNADLECPVSLRQSTFNYGKVKMHDILSACFDTSGNEIAQLDPGYANNMSVTINDAQDHPIDSYQGSSYMQEDAYIDAGEYILRVFYYDGSMHDYSVTFDITINKAPLNYDINYGKLNAEFMWVDLGTNPSGIPYFPAPDVRLQWMTFDENEDPMVLPTGRDLIPGEYRIWATLTGADVANFELEYVTYNISQEVSEENPATLTVSNVSMPELDLDSSDFADNTYSNDATYEFLSEASAHVGYWGNYGADCYAYWFYYDGDKKVEFTTTTNKGSYELYFELYGEDAQYFDPLTINIGSELWDYQNTPVDVVVDAYVLSDVTIYFGNEGGAPLQMYMDGYAEMNNNLYCSPYNFAFLAQSDSKPDVNVTIEGWKTDLSDDEEEVTADITNNIDTWYVTGLMTPDNNYTIDPDIRCKVTVNQRVFQIVTMNSVAYTGDKVKPEYNLTTENINPGEAIDWASPAARELILTDDEEGLNNTNLGIEVGSSNESGAYNYGVQFITGNSYYAFDFGGEYHVSKDWNYEITTNVPTVTFSTDGKEAFWHKQSMTTADDLAKKLEWIITTNDPEKFPDDQVELDTTFGTGGFKYAMYGDPYTWYDGIPTAINVGEQFRIQIKTTASSSGNYLAWEGTSDWFTVQEAPVYIVWEGAHDFIFTGSAQGPDKGDFNYYLYYPSVSEGGIIAAVADDTVFDKYHMWSANNTDGDNSSVIDLSTDSITGDQYGTWAGTYTITFDLISDADGFYTLVGDTITWKILQKEIEISQFSIPGTHTYGGYGSSYYDLPQINYVEASDGDEYPDMVIGTADGFGLAANQQRIAFETWEFALRTDAEVAAKDYTGDWTTWVAGGESPICPKNVGTYYVRYSAYFCNVSSFTNEGNRYYANTWDANQKSFYVDYQYAIIVIEPKHIEVTISNIETIEYGDAMPSGDKFTVSYAGGWAYGEGAAAEAALNAMVTFTCDYEQVKGSANSQPGFYTVTPASLVYANYAFDLVGSEALNVLPREITVTITDVNETYGNNMAGYYISGNKVKFTYATVTSGTLKPTAIAYEEDVADIFALWTETSVDSDSGITIGSSTNAGTYYIKGVSYDSTRYNVTFTNGVVGYGIFTVAKRDLDGFSITQTGKKTYNGYDQSSSGVVDITYGTCTGNVEDLVITYSKTAGDYVGALPNWTDASPYTVYYQVTSGNYNTFTSSYAFTISPAEIEFVTEPAQSGTLTYNGADQTPDLVTPSYSVYGGQEVSFFYGSEAGVYGEKDVVPQFKDVAGTKRIYWKATAANHEDATGSFEVTIDPKEVTVTFTKDELTKTYDSKAFDLDGVGTVEGTVEGESLTTVFGGGNIISASPYSKSFTLVAGNAQTTRSNYTLVAVGEQTGNVVNGGYGVFNEAGSVNVEITRRHLTYKQQIDGDNATSVTYNGAGKVFTLVVTNAQTSALEVLDDISLTLATAKNGEGAASVTETNQAAYTYYVKKAGGTAANYYLTNGDDETITFTIAEKIIDVTFALAAYREFTYGDVEAYNALAQINSKANFYGMLTLSEALSGGEAVADVIDLSFKKGGEITPIGATADVGKYVLYATIKEGVTNYAFNFLVNSDEKAYINITKKPLTATWNVAANGELHEDYSDQWFEFVYNGAGQKAVADPVGVVGEDEVYFVYGEYSETTYVTTNGMHYTTISGLGGAKAGNYSFNTSSENAEHNFKIIPKPITVQWGENAFTYTGAGQAPTVGITGGYLVEGDASDLALVEPTKQTNANTTQNPSYTATVSLSGTKAANYTITNNTYAFTIAPYEVTPALYIDDELVDDNASVTYDGNNHVFVIKATGLNEDVVIFYTSVNDEHINVFNSGTGYDAGFRGHATGVFDYNYAVDEYCYFTWAITARPLSLNWALEANGGYSGDQFPGYKTFTDFIYNGTVQHPVAELLNVVGDEDVEIVYPAGIKNAITNGGYHAYEIVSFKGNGKNNYVWANDAEKKVFFDMQAKPITVTIHDKTSVYGESTVGYTADVEGVVEGDEEKTLFSLACDVTSESDVGYYDITGTRLDTNYAITFLNEEDAYSITNAPLTVAVNVAGVTYGTAIKAPVVGDGITVTGWKNQDDATLIGEDQLTIIYIEKEDGKTIDEQLQALSELMEGALMDAESEEEEEEMYNAFIAPYLVAPTNAGTYYVYVFVEAGEEGTLFNYESADAYAEFTIAKAALTLSVSVADTTYGTAVVAPVLSNANDKGITINGWKYEDKAESLLNQANMSLVVLYFAKNADMTFGQQYAYEFGQIDFTNQAAVMQFMTEKSAVPTQAGEYYVFAKAQYLANYNDIEGYTHFTIAPKAVTVSYSDEVKNVIYGDVDALLALSLEMGTNSYYLTADLAAGDNIYDIVGVKIVDADGEEVAPSDTTEVGTYYLQAIDLGNPNYAVTIALGEKAKLVFGNATLTDVSVAQTGALTYNKTAQTAAVATAATAVNKMAFTFTYATAANGTYAAAVPAFTDAGTYTVYYKAAAANHNVATGSFVVTIAKKAISVTAENKESDYEAALVALTFTKAGIEEGDVVCTIATTADNTKVGTYPITLTSTNNSNYIVTLTNGTYTIKAKAEVNASGEVEKTEDIKAEIKEAKAEEGVSIKNMIRNVIEAAADAPVATLEIEVTDAATVAFDKAALKKLAENADVKITYIETKAEDVAEKAADNKALKNAQFIIEVSLQGASFDGGTATISTAFENKAPGGKKAVLYYVAEDGTKTEVEATFADGKLTFTTTHFSTYIVEYKLTGGSIAGIVIACVVGAAGIAVGVFFFLKKRKANGGNGGEAAADEAATETPADAE